MTAKKIEIFYLPLTQGLFSIIDYEDLARIENHSWCLQQYKSKSRNTKIYAKASIKGTQVLLHRFIMNAPKGSCIDHINGNSLDNRKENLRYATKQQNAASRPKDRVPGATSSFKGVYFSKQHGKWVARIHVNGKGIHLGLFLDELEAAAVYNIAAVKYFKEFAWLNQLP